MESYKRVPASSTQTILVMLYLMVSTVIIVFSMVKFWPHEPMTMNATSSVEYLSFSFNVHDEIRLLLLITFAGSLGSMVHALRSFVWYVGNQNLEKNWIPMYILRPFLGTVIGLVFYIVIRGGFYSPETMTEDSNLFVFVALSSIVGMFTEQAILKLKDIAEAILKEPEEGRDKEPDQEDEAEPEEQDQDSSDGDGEDNGVGPILDNPS